MRLIRVLFGHSLLGPAIRYGIAGCCVGAVYLGVPLVLNGLLGMSIEAAIPIAYALAIALHFNLQRHFVFRHVDEFALTTREQIGRYAMIGCVQYPTTALATGFLPGLLGIDERIVFVGVTLSISLIAFLLLRGHVFHPDVAEELELEVAAERREARLAAEADIAPERGATEVASSR